MKILGTSRYRGPNLFGPDAVLRWRIDFEALNEWPTGRLGPEFVGELVEHLPGLRARFDAADAADGVSLAEVLVWTALELQALGGNADLPGEARDAGAGVFDILVGYREVRNCSRALELSLRWIASLLPAEIRPPGLPVNSFDFPRERDTFAEIARRQALDQTTLAIIAAAERRGIPWFRLDDGGRFVQLGQGRHRKRIFESATGDTAYFAVEFSRHKAIASRIMGEAGLPVPVNHYARDADHAASLADRIGYPVVVKPADRGGGKGIQIHLTKPEQVRAAFEDARRYSRLVMVEKFIPGEDHRLLVVDGTLIAAAKRLPGHVVGDGHRSIEALIAEANRDPRRGSGFEKIMVRLELDVQARNLLKEQGLTPDSVPADGALVPLRRTANISTGGTAIDVTDSIHPDNRAMAERAARIIGLDVAGVDFLTRDIARSYLEIGGAICEINVTPGLRPHWIANPERDVVAPILDMMFPGGGNGRIPVAAITGTSGKTTTTRMVAHVLRGCGWTPGEVTTQGACVGGQWVLKGDVAGGGGARAVLRDPAVDIAVLETARGGIIKRGMSIDWCNVAAVLNVSDDHIGQDGINSLEELAAVKAVVARSARDVLVLNADDPLCLAMADGAPAKRVLLVSRDADNPGIAEHRARGGLAATLDGGGSGTLTLHDGDISHPVVAAAEIPATLDGKAAHNSENALFAAAICRALGIALDDIRSGLSSFTNSFEQNPGRLSFVPGLPFQAVLDYAHNPAKLTAVRDTVRLLDVDGRRICIVTTVGNRSIDQIAPAAAILAGNFDRYVCGPGEYADSVGDDVRGCPKQEIGPRIRDALIAESVAPEGIVCLDNPREAVLAGLKMVRDGDLLLVLHTETDWCWNLFSEAAAGRRG